MKKKKKQGKKRKWLIPLAVVLLAADFPRQCQRGAPLYGSWHLRAACGGGVFCSCGNESYSDQHAFGGGISGAWD